MLAQDHITQPYKLLKALYLIWHIHVLIYDLNLSLCFSLQLKELKMTLYITIILNVILDKKNGCSFQIQYSVVERFVWGIFCSHTKFFSSSPASFLQLQFLPHPFQIHVFFSFHTKVTWVLPVSESRRTLYWSVGSLTEAKSLIKMDSPFLSSQQLPTTTQLGVMLCPPLC